MHIFRGFYLSQLFFKMLLFYQAELLKILRYQIDVIRGNTQQYQALSNSSYGLDGMRNNPPRDKIEQTDGTIWKKYSQIIKPFFWKMFLISVPLWGWLLVICINQVHFIFNFYISSVFRETSGRVKRLFSITGSGSWE